MGSGFAVYGPAPGKPLFVWGTGQGSLISVCCVGWLAMSKSSNPPTRL